MGQMMPVPPAAISRVLAAFNREQLASFVTVAIDLMDLADGDPDRESDPQNEGEPAFDRHDREFVNRYSSGPGDCVSGDAEPAAWIERVDQSKNIRSTPITWELGNTEDAEEDDPQGDVTDDDPAFTKAGRRIANKGASGPGCSISDPGGDSLDAGELDEGRELAPPVYGVDQTKGPLNEGAAYSAYLREQAKSDAEGERRWEAARRARDVFIQEPTKH